MVILACYAPYSEIVMEIGERRCLDHYILGHRGKADELRLIGGVWGMTVLTTPVDDEGGKKNYGSESSYHITLFYASNFVPTNTGQGLQ